MSAEEPAMSSGNGKLDRYPGIRPFSPNEAMLFYGRTAELNELLNSIKAYNLFVLHGKSGLGKTSLLNAGLIPLLEKEGYMPIEIAFRFTNISGNVNSNKIETLDPFKAIEKAFKGFIDSKVLGSLSTKHKTLWIYLKLLKTQGKTPVLIFDQFEEFFSYPNKQHKDNIIRQMAELLNDKAPDYVYDFMTLNKDTDTPGQIQFTSPPQVRLLFSIRSDKISLLDELKTLIPSITNKRFQLNPLFRSQAKQAILLPASLLSFGKQSFGRPPFEYDDKALETILKVLGSSKQNIEGDGEIESTQLQIICGSIESKMPLVNDSDDNVEDIKVTEETFNGEEGLRNILQNFYDDQLKELAKNEYITIYDIDRVREMIETKMIYEGVRLGLLQKQVTNFLKDTETVTDDENRIKKANTIIGHLMDLRLIRPEESYLGTTFVITHDTLIDPITESHKQYVEDKTTKASTIYPAFLATLRMNPQFTDKQIEEIVDLIETKLIVNGERVEMSEAAVFEALSIRPKTELKGFLYDCTTNGLLKMKQTGSNVSYELANDFLIEPILKEHRLRKAEADYQRVKKEKEILEQLQKKNRKLRRWIGGIIVAALVLAYIVRILISNQSDQKHAETLDLMADKSYTEGNHPLAYVLWTKAIALDGDSNIEHKLKYKVFSPYFGVNIMVSPMQQFVAVLNENGVLTVWRDSDRSDIVLELKSIEEFRFIPNASILVTQDTARHVQFLKLLEGGKPMKFKTDSFELAQVALNSSNDWKVDASGNFFSIQVRAAGTEKQRFFWNINGKYLKNISKFYSVYENKRRSRSPFDSPQERIAASRSYSERSVNGSLLIVNDRLPYLLDMSNDSIYTILNLTKTPEATVTRFLNSTYYAIDVFNDEKYVTHVLNSANKQIIYTSAPAAARPQFSDKTRLITEEKDGLVLQDFISQSTSFVRMPELNKYPVRAVLVDEKLLLVNQATDTTQQLLVKDISGKTLQDVKSAIISFKLAQKRYIVYKSIDSSLYIYDCKENTTSRVTDKVRHFTLLKDSLSVLVETEDDFVIVDLPSKKHVQLSKEGKNVYITGTLIDRFFITKISDTLKVYDPKKNSIILNKRFNLSDYSDVDVFFPKFIQVTDNLGRQHLLYLDSTQNIPSRLPERFKSSIDKKMKELGESKK